VKNGAPLPLAQGRTMQYQRTDTLKEQGSIQAGYIGIGHRIIGHRSREILAI
jgi:hypothetical protein